MIDSGIVLLLLALPSGTVASDSYHTLSSCCTIKSWGNCSDSEPLPKKYVLLDSVQESTAFENKLSIALKDARFHSESKTVKMFYFSC